MFLHIMYGLPFPDMEPINTVHEESVLNHFDIHT